MKVSTFPKRTLAPALLAIVALAGCGSSNADKVNNAKKSEASAAQIHRKLKQELDLHRYAGTEDNFTVPVGSPDVYAGQSGTECSIDGISAPASSLDQSDPDTLVAPDKSASVKVVAFQGSSQSLCLQTARQALGW